MAVKEEISKFAQNTSLKGVSRLSRANSMEIRLLWSFAILASLILGCLYSATIFNDYLTFSTVTQIKTHSSRNQTFPHLQVCNLNPFVWLKNLPENETYSFYVEMVHNKTRCKNCSDWEQEYLELLRGEQLIMARYELYLRISPHLRLHKNNLSAAVDKMETKIKRIPCVDVWFSVIQGLRLTPPTYKANKCNR